MKRYLYVTHLSGKRVNRFWLSSFGAARKLGFELHIACNMTETSPKEWERDCAELGLITHQIDFERSPLAIHNIKAAKQLGKLFNEVEFDLVHCNTPVAGAITRIVAARFPEMTVVYQAHGFHFYKGAPFYNWALFYPIERALAHLTDVLITINHEDYERAKKFNAGKVIYVPGVGVDTDRFASALESREAKREELGFAAGDFALLSVGELNTNKNHRVVVEALGKLASRGELGKLRYIICGQGCLAYELKKLADSFGIEDRLELLGFRDDIPEVLAACDAFVFPSKREGLPVSLMEAMAVGLPCICSPIRGNLDLVEDGVSGLVVTAEQSRLATAIQLLITKPELCKELGLAAMAAVKSFDYSTVEKKMICVYASKEMVPTDREDCSRTMSI